MSSPSFEDVAVESTKYFEDGMSGEVFASKYALRDTNGIYKELTPDAMHRRLAKEFARIDAKLTPKAFKERILTEDQIYELFRNFKYIVPQGSPMTAIGNPFFLMSASNCTVIDSPADDMGSIMDAGNQMAQLMKRRCGVGVDISNLRPHSAPVNNAAVSSSGAYSFADYYSYISRMIGQKGRQGALMITLDVRHPDAERFATMKKDITKVTGANVSLKITDDFMKAVEKDSDFVLRWPVEGKLKKRRKIRAQNLFDVIVKSAYLTGDPGLLMWDNVCKNLPADFYPEFKTIATNPCAEIPLSANDCCRLISLCLSNYVSNPYSSGAQFDFELFKKHTEMSMRLSDDLVELELELMDRLIKKSTNKLEKDLWKKMQNAAKKGRRTGLGTHGLGDALAKLCIKYDTEEAHGVAHKIFKLFRDTAYKVSIDLAEERGAFPLFNWELEKKCAFFKRMNAC